MQSSTERSLLCFTASIQLEATPADEEPRTSDRPHQKIGYKSRPSLIVDF
ncbi:MAG: hypothetical protein F6K32_27615 [Desertifilum sp. SIO1I2]|nr:hypothetical protein [Desertifilum sp. SIO1I2]